METVMRFVLFWVYAPLITIFIVFGLYFWKKPVLSLLYWILDRLYQYTTEYDCYMEKRHWIMYILYMIYKYEEWCSQEFTWWRGFHDDTINTYRSSF